MCMCAHAHIYCIANLFMLVSWKERFDLNTLLLAASPTNGSQNVKDTIQETGKNTDRKDGLVHKYPCI
jgi:hypothetical protein